MLSGHGAKIDIGHGDGHPGQSPVEAFESAGLFGSGQLQPAHRRLRLGDLHTSCSVASILNRQHPALVISPEHLQNGQNVPPARSKIEPKPLTPLSKKI